VIVTQQLNYIWRLFGTGLSFLLFGVGGLVFSLLIFPLLSLFTRNPARLQSRARAVTGALFRVFLWIMETLGVGRFDVQRGGGLPPEGNCLVVANHPTLIDVVFLIALFPQSDCVVKASLWRNPFMRGVLRAANHIPNDDSIELLNECVSRLRGGGTLILFPEGTRTQRDRKLRFKVGAAAVAVRADARLLPVLIECNPLTLGKGEPWYLIPERRPTIRVRVLESLTVDDFIGREGSERVRKRTLNTELKAFFVERLEG
jgi:1-acyl-sn-glycerol-3-phosphate acyltransferase